MSVPTGTVGVPSTSPSAVSDGLPVNNSAPPALSSTPPTKKQGITFKDLIVAILYLVFTGYAIYYGWIMGQQHGREYLMYVQSYGPWLRSWFTRN